MKFGASLRTRHVIARLEQGEDFIGTLKKFFKRERAKSCVFTGLGFFSKCTLQTLNLEKREIETFFTSDALMTVANITGNIATMGNEVIVYATCSGLYRAFGQMHPIAGLIQDARVYSIDLHITVFDDLHLTRAYDPMTGLVPIQKIHNAYDEVYAQTDMTFVQNDLSHPNMDFASMLDSGIPALEGGSEFFASPSHFPETVIRRGGKSVLPQAEEKVENAAPLVEESLASTHSIGVKEDSKEASKSDNKVNSKLDAKHDDLEDSQMTPQKRRIKCSASSKGAKKKETVAVADLPLKSWIKHPIFGLCTVESKHDNGTTIHIRTESSIVNEISLKFFDIELCEQIDDKPCYVLCKKSAES